ncbi:MAG: hypothetical protein ACLFTS_02845 [Candidatus Paceibacterota bacterium]
MGSSPILSANKDEKAKLLRILARVRRWDENRVVAKPDLEERKIGRRRVEVKGVRFF